jgi:hypothetical protein
MKEETPEQWFLGKKYKCYEGRRYFTSHKWSLHRDVWEHYNGSIPQGYEVHHIDENTHNNSIENLSLVKAGEHQYIHSKKRFEENPEWYEEFQKLGTEAAKEWHKSKEGSLWHSQHAKESYLKREYVKKICKECSKEYETKHAGKSFYCHLNCRARANRRKRIQEDS